MQTVAVGAVGRLRPGHRVPVNMRYTNRRILYFTLLPADM